MLALYLSGGGLATSDINFVIPSSGSAGLEEERKYFEPEFILKNVL